MARNESSRPNPYFKTSKKIAGDFTRKRWRGIKSNLFIEKTVVFWKKITR